ncbi:MAG: Stp1/IreP family PP2C-type Ser/Thr phosphatase [Solobacterium sp.]|nr:Stp1/IreP family PP2C-type Ser/Thr phosphatase [Solobacterium sp.]
MKYYGITDKGKLRKTNQDNYVIATNEDGDVFAIICDGIGGNRGGDIASQLAVSYFSEAFSKTSSFDDEYETKRWIRTNVEIANKRIFDTSAARPILKGMGTTLCGVLITKKNYFLVNVGDSRVYAYYKDGSFKQMTVDHTLLNDMLMRGEITEEEVKDFPQKNVITNALGVWENVRCDIMTESNDVSGFLLCSDGLHGYVSERTISTIVKDTESAPSRRVRKLIKTALDAGGYDNITAIIIDLEREFDE